MLKKLIQWLFPTEVDGFNYNAADRDGDGIVQEGTPFERKLEKEMKKVTVKKAAPKKKAPAKKSPAKKTAPKKTTKKTTKKK